MSASHESMSGTLQLSWTTPTDTSTFRVECAQPAGTKSTSPPSWTSSSGGVEEAASVGYSFSSHCAAGRREKLAAAGGSRNHRLRPWASRLTALP